jgi:hypothetical protein
MATVGSGGGSSYHNHMPCLTDGFLGPTLSFHPFRTSTMADGQVASQGAMKVGKLPDLIDLQGLKRCSSMPLPLLRPQ